MGFSVFQNVGLLAILGIFLPKWFMGEKLDIGDGFTLLAMLYYLFFSVNSMTYYSMNTINQALAVIYRLSEVFRMEEHKKSQSLGRAEGDEPAVKLVNAEYVWGYRISDD